jgi:hypothetical protein
MNVMMKARLIRPAMAAVVVMVSSLAGSASAGEHKATPVLAHRAEAAFDIGNHTVVIRDRIAVPAGLGFLRLGDGLAVSELAADGQPVLTVANVLARVDDSPAEGGPWQRLDLAAAGLAGGGELVLRYAGTFNTPVDQVEFSRENVGGEISATISAEGIYLASSSGWLAGADSTLATYDVTLVTPAGYETVTQG